jgi:peptide-methionine (S)-S-oxide reductase
MLHTAVFGGGCFWCTEAVFRELRGVHSVEPGYTGGTTANPTYEEVSTGETGHAEVIKIDYDPTQVSYRTLLTVFFATHDPTTVNRQGPDTGTQYRSSIFTTTPEQEAEAAAFIKEVDTSTNAGEHVVTSVEPLTTFYPAEDYHREYFKKHPEAAYCQLVVSPKVEKVQKEFADLLKQNHHEN